MNFPELFVLALARVPLFVGCRKFLLRTATATTSFYSSTSLELDSLPLPAGSPKQKFGINAHAAVSRNVFSLVFTESSMMFFVLMLQGIRLFAPSARLYSWKFSLIFLMAIILVLVPLSVSFVLAIGTRSVSSTSDRRLSSSRLVFGTIVVAIYLFLVSKIPLPTALGAASSFTSTLARLIVLGTIILGLLSGFGAISNAWTYIPQFGRSNAVPTEEDVRAQEYALQSVRSDLDVRRAAAERQASAASESSWFSRVVPNFRGGDSLSQELRGLEALEYQMSQKVEAMRARRDAERYSRTLRGRIFNIGGFIFAFYCVLRIVSSALNVILPNRQQSPTSYPDVVAEVLASLLSHVSSTKISLEEIVSFARHISLILVGVIILTSVRRVLQGVTRALRVTSRSLGASLMLLFLAQLMGIYLLSTIVQLRNTFPPVPSPPGQIDSSPNQGQNLFSTIPQFEVFGSLFDWSFLLAAGVSAFARWGAERVNGMED